MHVDVQDAISDEENPVDKNFDAVSFAKRVVNDGVSAVSEQQATELIQKYASRSPPAEREARSGLRPHLQRR